MRVLIWAAAILAALVCFLWLTRLRLTGVYGEEGASLTVALGAVPVFRLPRSRAEIGQRPKKKKNREKKKKKKKPAENGEADKGGGLPGFRQLMPIISDALGKLKRRLSINEMTLWYQSASEDPASAALAFGGAQAAAAALAQPMRDMFRIRALDLRASVSFTETKPRVYARIRMSISVGVLLLIGLRAFVRFWKLKRAGKTGSGK